MAMGGGGQNQGPLSDINVTPLVDVMLVLLIIFMVAAPMMTQGVDVNLPQTQAGPLDDRQQPLVVTVTPAHQVFIDDRRTSLEALGADIAREESRQGRRPVFLRADQTVPYGTVVQVMGILKAAGVEKLGMITEPPERRPGG